MELRIDGHRIQAETGQSLLDLIRVLGLDSNELSKRPLAAKLAGEVFNLNYVPVRSADAQADRISIRRAMAASNGNVTLLRYSDPAGRDVYERSVQFLLFLALHRLWPRARAKMNCTVGRALYIEVRDESFSVPMLKKEIQSLVAQDTPLLRRRIPLSVAVQHYQTDGQLDKARLLSWRKQDYFDEYFYGEFADYYYGELVPSMRNQIFSRLCRTSHKYYEQSRCHGVKRSRMPHAACAVSAAHLVYNIVRGNTGVLVNEQHAGDFFLCLLHFTV